MDFTGFDSLAAPPKPTPCRRRGSAGLTQKVESWIVHGMAVRELPITKTALFVSAWVSWVGNPARQVFLKSTPLTNVACPRSLVVGHYFER